MEITVRSAAGARYEENGDDARESRMQKAGNTRGHAEEEASAMGENGRRDSATRRYARRCE